VACNNRIAPTSMKGGGSSTSVSTPIITTMSLNSVVNNLVRAAAGIPADISDGDLDRHVAELLAKEAKVRDAKWSEIGLGGLLGNDRSQ